MFDTFCMAAFARNGRIPDDLEQRSIVIELQRRLPNEPLAVLRDDRCEDLTNLARMCCRWADDYADDIAGTHPDMGGLINRVADNWRPLFTLADLIGFEWPKRIREAAHALIGSEPDSDDSVLLADTKEAFEAKGVDRLSSEEICESLTAIEGRPWAEYGKAGRPITKNQLARRLKRFKIVPDTIRVGGKTAKGYYRHQFEQAWSRYLSSSTPQESPSEASQRNNVDQMDTSDAFSNVTEESCYASETEQKIDVTFEKMRKTPSNGHCYAVTFQKGINGGGSAGSVMCEHCGLPGADDFPFGYGEFTASLHPHCRNAWAATKDDLTIPPYLDRRPGLST